MSYNIDSTAVLKCTAKMKATDVYLLLAKHEDDLPECHFLEEMRGVAPDTDGFIQVDKRFWWYGDGSGRAFKFLCEKVAPCIVGTAEVVFTWEGGDSFSGLRIVDGKVTKHKVKMVLGEIEK